MKSTFPFIYTRVPRCAERYASARADQPAAERVYNRIIRYVPRRAMRRSSQRAQQVPPPSRGFVRNSQQYHRISGEDKIRIAAVVVPRHNNNDENNGETSRRVIIKSRTIALVPKTDGRSRIDRFRPGRIVFGRRCSEGCRIVPETFLSARRLFFSHGSPSAPFAFSAVFTF